MRKLMIAFTVTLIASAPLAAADGPPPPVQVVATILGLSDSQVVSWIDLLRARDVALQPLHQQLQTRQEALGKMLQTPNPDPAALGALLIEVRATQQQIGAVVTQTNAQFEQSLTSDQRDRLQHIREAAHVCNVVPAFQATGLL